LTPARTLNHSKSSVIAFTSTRAAALPSSVLLPPLRHTYTTVVYLAGWK